MIALLDPKTWLAIVLVPSINGGIDYWRGNTAGQAAVQAKWDKAKAAAIEAAAKAKDQDIDKGQHPIPSRKDKACRANPRGAPRGCAHCYWPLP